MTQEVVSNEIILLKNAVNREEYKKISRFPLGISVIDYHIKGGVKEGDLIIISGSSGNGKTLFAQSLTYNFCKKNIKCLWFSYEMTLEALDEKFADMRIDDFYHAYTPKKVSDRRLEWIESKILEGVKNEGIKLVIIDHLSMIIKANQNKYETSESNIDSIVSELKQFAINNKIILILLTHLTKNLHSDEPEMEDVKGSSSIYQLADLQLIIMRDKNKSPNIWDNKFLSTSTLKIVKNRETGFTTKLTLEYKDGRLQEQLY